MNTNLPAKVFKFGKYSFQNRHSFDLIARLFLISNDNSLKAVSVVVNSGHISSSDAVADVFDSMFGFL